MAFYIKNGMPTHGTPKLSRREHERIMRKELPKFWAPGGMYHEVERNRMPFLAAMKAGMKPVYRHLLPSEGEILVHGAGRGFEREIFPPELPNSRIMFSDLHEDSLREIERKYPGARTKPGSSFELPFEADRFAAVTSLDHLDVFQEHHLPRVIGEARRVLRPGGILLATQSSLPSLQYWSKDPDAILRQRDSGKGASDRLVKDVHDRYTKAVMGAMRKGGLVDVQMQPIRGIYVGPREPRHLERLSKVPISYDGLLALIADRGNAMPTLLTEENLRKLGIPPLPVLNARLGNPLAEIYLSYVIHGRKPASG